MKIPLLNNKQSEKERIDNAVKKISYLTDRIILESSRLSKRYRRRVAPEIITSLMREFATEIIVHDYQLTFRPTLQKNIADGLVTAYVIFVTIYLFLLFISGLK